MFSFPARQGVIAALFIIFLGIIPFIAIVVLISYYARHNFRFGWKKSPAATYVIKCLQHAVSACKGVGSSFKMSSTASPDPLTKQHINRNDIEIKQTGLISTTNTDCILRSKTITNKDDLGGESVQDKHSKPKTAPKSEWRASLKNFRRLSLKINNKTDVDSPKTTETICDDETPQVSVSVKNMTRQLEFSKQLPCSKI